MLELLNHELMVTHNGSTALATAYEKEPDIAFLNTSMPGLTGLEVASAIRSNGNEPTELLTILSSLQVWRETLNRYRI